MVRYFLTLAYNGTPFHGWQRQPNAISVQQTLEEALSTLLRQPIAIVGAGRTDTGVHARMMVAHFDAELDQSTQENLVHKLNSFLNENIAIYRLQAVHETAHARFDANSRSYEYQLEFDKNPFKHQAAYRIYQLPDLEVMNRAAAMLLKHKDFEAFSKSNTDVKTFLCTITHAQWEPTHRGAVFYISANRFLRNMVRAIVGTLLEIGWGKLTLDDMNRIIESKNRGEAGFSVPASGLYLTQITYPEEIYK